MNQKTYCFDFDGVIAKYDGWKGVDVFGEPIPATIEAMRRLKEQGGRIIIFTTRLATPALISWLQRNQVPYDEINKNSKNPPMTSVKPIYDVFIDDRALNYHGQGVGELLSEINRIIAKGD